MARAPKHDAPSLAYFFLLLCIVGITVFSVGVGILALGTELREIINGLLWVLT